MISRRWPVAIEPPLHHRGRFSHRHPATPHPAGALVPALSPPVAGGAARRRRQPVDRRIRDRWPLDEDAEHDDLVSDAGELGADHVGPDIPAAAAGCSSERIAPPTDPARTVASCRRGPAQVGSDVAAATRAPARRDAVLDGVEDAVVPGPPAAVQRALPVRWSTRVRSVQWPALVDHGQQSAPDGLGFPSTPSAQVLPLARPGPGRHRPGPAGRRWAARRCCPARASAYDNGGHGGTVGVSRFTRPGLWITQAPSALVAVVETKGIEPSTPALQSPPTRDTRRSTSDNVRTCQHTTGHGAHPEPTFRVMRRVTGRVARPRRCPAHLRAGSGGARACWVGTGMELSASRLRAITPAMRAARTPVLRPGAGIGASVQTVDHAVASRSRAPGWISVPSLTAAVGRAGSVMPEAGRVGVGRRARRDHRVRPPRSAPSPGIQVTRVVPHHSPAAVTAPGPVPTPRPLAPEEPHFMLAGQVDVVGVDTHRDTNTAAVVNSATMGVLAHIECGTDALGHVGGGRRTACLPPCRTSADVVRPGPAAGPGGRAP
jgi:hypothetical protein